MKLDLSWTKDAACRGMPTAMFFPDDKAGTVSPRVQQVCDECQVSEQCDAHAMRHEPAGYWNGTSANARKIRRTKLGAPLIRIRTHLDDIDGPDLPDDEWGEAG